MVWRDYEKEIESFFKNLNVSRRNKETLYRINEYLIKNNISDSRRIRYLYTLKKIIQITGKLKQLNTQDMLVIEKHISSLKPHTQQEYKKAVSLINRVFNKRLMLFTEKPKRRIFYPIIDKDRFVNEILPQVDKKYQDFLWLLWDVGARPHEIANLKRENIVKRNDHYILYLDGKTGKRMVRTITFKGFIDLSKEKPFGHIKQLNFNRYINKLEKKLKFPLWPYLLRHSRASELASVLTEQELKSWFGWTPDSKMLNTYIHIQNMKVINKISSFVAVESKSLDTPRPSVAQEGSKEINYIA